MFGKKGYNYMLSYCFVINIDIAFSCFIKAVSSVYNRIVQNIILLGQFFENIVVYICFCVNPQKNLVWWRHSTAQRVAYMYSVLFQELRNTLLI